MDLIIKNPQLAIWGGREFRCAVGRSGIVLPSEKKEGDGATPAGRWAMRELIYRPDRVTSFVAHLPLRAMKLNDGWCENVFDANYNRPVQHPYRVAVDEMWREDHLYDIIVPLGYNDDPIVPGKGSAIFLHLARRDYSPTAGCVGLALDDLLAVLRDATPTSSVVVTPQS